MGTPYVDRIPASKRAAGQLNVAATNSVITDAMVSANTTITTLKAAVLSVGAAIPSNYPIAVKTAEALELGKTISIFPETHGVATVSALAALGDLDVATRRMGIWS
jgi:hypothetical protein